MADNNKQIEKSGAYEDDDPTAELEVLPGPGSAEFEAESREFEAESRDETESDERTSDPAAYVADVGDADEAVVSFESGFQSCAETVEVLQFQTEAPRPERTGFEKEVNALEAMINKITEELQIAHEKQFHTSELLKNRDKDIDALRSQLEGQERMLIEFAQQIDDAKNNVQESKSIDSKSSLINRHERDLNDEPDELASLVPVNGNGSSEHPIRTGRLSLGSSPDNDIQIKSEFISRHHAQIVSSSTDSVLGDLNSTNGTYVNSKRIKRHALRNGDSITIGKLRFKYVEKNPGSSD